MQRVLRYKVKEKGFFRDLPETIWRKKKQIFSVDFQRIYQVTHHWVVGWVGLSKFKKLNMASPQGALFFYFLFFILGFRSVFSICIEVQLYLDLCRTDPFRKKHSLPSLNLTPLVNEVVALHSSVLLFYFFGVYQFFIYIFNSNYIILVQITK